MSSIVLIDTSVLMNVLNIPGFNSDFDDVFEQFEQFVDEGAHIFIPMAAIFEAGNHIAQIGNGRVRRTTAQAFCAAIIEALDGGAPWKAVHFHDADTLRQWLLEFPDEATAGRGMGDLSIKHEWQRHCDKYPFSRVLIWTLDADLAGHDRRQRVVRR